MFNLINLILSTESYKKITTPQHKQRKTQFSESLYQAFGKSDKIYPKILASCRYAAEATSPKINRIADLRSLAYEVLIYDTTMNIPLLSALLSVFEHIRSDAVAFQAFRALVQREKEGRKQSRS